MDMYPIPKWARIDNVDCIDVGPRHRHVGDLPAVLREYEWVAAAWQGSNVTLFFWSPRQPQSLCRHPVQNASVVFTNDKYPRAFDIFRFLSYFY